MTLHRVARLADIPEDRGLEVSVQDSKILLLKVGDQVRAYQGECPHAGAPLAEGALCHGRLTCPWHKAQFRIEDGGLCEPPALDSLKRYPLEVRDDEVWVGDQPLQDAHTPPADDERTFVIVGAGAAGTAAASALREKGFGGRVLLIDREAGAGYDRTVLSKFVIAGEMPPEEVPPLRDEDFYREQRIERMNAEVASLDAANKTLRLVDGQSLKYDAALLATGGIPNPLELPGADLPQVFVLRSKADAQQILHTAKPGQRAVIIGDSFIAMESASSLRQYGLEVTVLARQPVPFAKQFGDSVGKAILALHEANGVVYRTEGQAAQIEGTTRVEAVRLDNDQRLPADLVLVGIGVTPATAAVCRSAEGKGPVAAGRRRDAREPTDSGRLAISRPLRSTVSPIASNTGAWRNNRRGSRRRTCSVAMNITSTCRISGPGTLAKTTTTLATRKPGTKSSSRVILATRLLSACSAKTAW